MDIKAKIDEIVNKVKSDPDIASKFQKDPIKTVEGILGVDLPDDVIKQIVDGVKAKVNVDELKGKIGALGGLFDGIPQPSRSFKSLIASTSFRNFSSLIRHAKAADGKKPQRCPSAKRLEPS